MALSKRTTCNRFSARSLLGKRASERVKGHVRVGTSERPADRERTRRNNWKKRGRRETRSKRVNRVWWALSGAGMPPG